MIVAINIVFGILWGVNRVYAQSAEAEKLFNDGNRFMADHQLLEACTAFEASNRIEPRAGALLRLGECREENHQFASAWSAYKDARNLAIDPRKRQLATNKIVALEPRLSYLTVVVSDQNRIQGLTLTRNSKPLDPMLWNRALPVDGGDYVVIGRAPGCETWQRSIHVPVEGAKLNLSVPALTKNSRVTSPEMSSPPALSKPPATSPTPPTVTVPASTVMQQNVNVAMPPPTVVVVPAPDRVSASPKPTENVAPVGPMPPASAVRAADPPLHEHIANRSWAAWKPWVAVGAGVGVAAVGGVIDVFAAHNFDAYDSGFVNLPCSVHGCTPQQVDQSAPHLSSRLSRARLEQQIAIGGFIAGGAAIAAGFALAYLNQLRQTERDNPSKCTPGMAVIPAVSRDLVGVMVTVSR